MMDGNPNWWGMFSPSLFPSQFPSSSSSLPINSFSDSRDQPQSWSQLLLGDEERYMNENQSHFQAKRLENWEDQVLNPSPASSPTAPFGDNIVKQEFSNESNNFYSQRKSEEEILIQTGSCPPAAATAAWSHMAVQVSSPASSCVSTLTTHQNNKFLNFSYNNKVDQKNNNQGLENPSECHSSATGGACKKARVHQPSSSQPPLKVRKEKLVDRITALHQIVSPFGKTDTASVLSEAIGYIRFLQGQIEALSSPYLGNTPKNIKNPQSALLNDSCLKRKFAIHNQENNMEKPLKDLRSRGLCLVPVSCTQVVGSDNNGADYWAPPYGTTGF